MESRKMVLKNLFAGQRGRNMHREKTYGHEKGGGESEMCGKSNSETCINICKIDSKMEFAVWFRKLTQRLCINLAGWNGEGDRGRFKREGIDVYLWLNHVEA